MKPIVPAGLAEQPHHTPEQRAKIKTVLDFYSTCVLECDFDRLDQYLGPYYKQHNAEAEDGIDGLKRFALKMKALSPDGYMKFHRALCDGDLVVTHGEGQLDKDSPINCIYDMFRIENGKVVEHWDAIAAVPETTANGNGAF